MSEIRILTEKDGRVVLNNTAKRGVSVAAICDIAMKEVDGGFADRATVFVGEEVYAEYEPTEYDPNDWWCDI